jgi:hypothetical protein
VRLGLGQRGEAGGEVGGDLLERLGELGVLCGIPGVAGLER